VRLNIQNKSAESLAPEAGSLLIAHPMLQDPNFHRTVIFLAAHDSEEGSLGLIMNRPMNKTLGELGSVSSDSALARIPLYRGGPVALDKLILVAWKWIREEGALQLQFGIDADKAERLLKDDSGFQIRAYMGHAGWTEGQLDFEIAQQSWLLSGWLPDSMEGDGEGLWRDILLEVNPAMRLLLDAPDDPSRN